VLAIQSPSCGLRLLGNFIHPSGQSLSLILKAAVAADAASTLVVVTKVPDISANATTIAIEATIALIYEISSFCSHYFSNI
jgi:hypothetical protein